MQFKQGDLLRTTKDLVVRKDCLCFDEADADKDGKILRSWFDAADELPAGSFCSFLRDGDEDHDYVVARRDLVGRPIVIRRGYVSLVSGIDDAVDDQIG